MEEAREANNRGCVSRGEARESFPNPTTSALTPLPSFSPLLSPSIQSGYAFTRIYGSRRRRELPATKLRLPPPLWGFLCSSFVAFGQWRRHENVHLALFIVWRKHPVCKKTGRSVICREALIRCLEHYFPRIYCLHIASRRGVTKESLNRHLSSFLGLSF